MGVRGGEDVVLTADRRAGSPEPGRNGTGAEVSSLTLNRLSVYLRCLRHLQTLGQRTISSQNLARRYNLSAAQIRKDLAQFGEFGTRGVGYDVDELVEGLRSVLGLDRQRRLIVVGVGKLGTALAQFVSGSEGTFQVVAAVDKDPSKVGRPVGHLTVQDSRRLSAIVGESGAEIGVLAVPAEAAQENYDKLVAAGIRAVLNFAPVNLRLDSAVPAKNVDLRIHLEELAFLLRAG